MDRTGLGAGEIDEVHELAGGTQNIMLRFRRGADRFVLRRGPQHPRERANLTLCREMRLLRALQETDVPHARLLGACEDPSVMGGTVFYLMPVINGYNAAVELSEQARTDSTWRHRMGLELIDSLASLGQLDHTAIGLSDYGRAEGFLERQVGRWLHELETYSALEGYTPGRLGDLTTMATQLERLRPKAWSPGILHGDFHIANVMFDYTQPTVAAVIDWEMSTIGDPLMDLGEVLALWPQNDGSPDLLGSALSIAGGLPTADELVERYATNTSRDLSMIDWYTAMAGFRLGIVLEGTYARARAGLAPTAVGDRLGAIAVALLERSRERLDSLA